VRQRGKAAFEALLAGATPLSEFLLSELTRQHALTTAEGRAGFVAAVRPLLQQIAAPILSAVMRRRVAELAGLPEDELRALLGRPAAASRGESPRPAEQPVRPAARKQLGRRPEPSLVRALLERLLLHPELARSVAMPRPAETTPEAGALNALIDFCTGHTAPLSTPGVVQAFVGSPHESTLVQALAHAEDQGLDEQQAALELAEGVRRFWLQAQRAGQPVAAAALGVVSPEEAERLRQRELGREARSGRRGGGA